jgi:hypothetical protein
MEKKIYLIRSIFQDEQTLGNLFVIDEKGTVNYSCKTLELGWKNNEKNISCIPPGTYDIVLEYSPKFDRDLWELKDVPGRTEIKIHPANFYDQLHGCIALGDRFKKIDGVDYIDIVNSALAVRRLHWVLENLKKTKITIL